MKKQIELHEPEDFKVEKVDSSESMSKRFVSSGKSVKRYSDNTNSKLIL